MCEECLQTEVELKKHIESIHRVNSLKSILKNPKVTITPKKEVSVDEMLTDLNTKMNGTKSETAKILIKTMKDVVQFKWKDDPLYCNVCEVASPTKLALINHKVSEHGQETSVVSQECAKRLETESDLKAHKQSIHGQKKGFACEECAKKFETEKYVKAHKQSVHGQHFLTCELCGKEFETENYLKAHKQRIHGRKYFITCQLCGKEFETETDMEAHKQSKHETVTEFEALFLSHHDTGNDLNIENEDDVLCQLS